MDFCNLELWLFVFVALLINIIINKLFVESAGLLLSRKLLILSLSLIILGYVSKVSLCVFLYVVVTGYIGSKALATVGKKYRKALLFVLILFLILPLLYYKYGYFLMSNMMCFRQWDTLRDLIIPVGVSFYTFQIVGYCIDTSKAEARQPAFIDYINFCSFFPQIVAGPIERMEALLPQVKDMRLVNTPAQVYQGISYIITGIFFKSCMADNAEMISSSAHACESVWFIWMQNLLFGLRIYFDFAGYGLAAYGLAQCLGVKLQMNFWSPYTAANISEFWRRWHISLTGWFRDYIYFPLGGSRTCFWAVNIILVFLISGIWHGAGWNFIVWGGLAGIGMVAHRFYRKLGGHMPSFAGWMLSMVWAFFSWMFFYETDLSVLIGRLHKIINISYYIKDNPFKVLDANLSDGYIFISFIVLSFIVIFMEYLSMKKAGNPYHYIMRLPSLCLMIVLIILCNPGTSNQFIYFSF